MRRDQTRRSPGTALLLTLLALALPGEAQRKCGAAKDLLVHALEQMTPASTPDQIDRASGLVQTSVGMCAELGDAWYYRSLLLRKAGQTQQANGALAHAQRLGSEAAAEGRDPFVLAVRSGAKVPSGLPREKWALVIGVAKFQDPHIHPSEFTVADAQSFADVLRNPAIGGFKHDNVLVLTDEGATSKAMKAGLNWLARSAKEDDLVVIYVATHGSPGDWDTRGVNYVLSYDTEVGPTTTEEERHKSEDNLFGSALPMVDIAGTVTSRIEATRVAIFLDTCYSQKAMGGAAVAGAATRAVSVDTLEHIRQGAGRMIFAASGGDQESQESEDLKHGYFTYYLLEALQKQGGGAQLSQVYEYVRTHVSADVAQRYHLSGAHQDPVMSRSDPATDFPLGSGAAPAKAQALVGAAGPGR